MSRDGQIGSVWAKTERESTVGCRPFGRHRHHILQQNGCNFRSKNAILKSLRIYKGHPPSVDLRYGEKLSISPSTLVCAATRS